ncbi:hypothetical protein [Alicyclobacillus tolerans]|uniref:hypothetical protein n=1 Tax=Alicyclobacillus tolerans TaxID=90970 RepID=UPI003B9845FB
MSLPVASDERTDARQNSSRPMRKREILDAENGTPIAKAGTVFVSSYSIPMNLIVQMMKPNIQLHATQSNNRFCSRIHFFMT